MTRSSALTLAAIGLVAAACAHTAPTTAAPATTATTAATTSAPPASAPVSAEELVDHEGDSVQTAVPVPKDAPNEGADFQNNWIFQRYGRFRRTGGGTGTLDTRHYDVVEIELPSGETKKIYFDITELWNSWRPPQN